MNVEFAILAENALTDSDGIYSNTVDSRKIFTPFKLASEMLDQVKLGENNLVFNMEFVLVLKDMGLINTVWFATVCDLQERAMIAFGVDKSRIIRYNYNKLDEFPKDMKFDVVIANPPYEKNKWEKFIRLGYSITKKGGWVSFITPRWSILKGKNKIRRLIMSLSDVKVIKHLQSSDFKTIRNGNNEQIRVVPQYFIAKVGNSTNSPVTISRSWKFSKKEFVAKWDVKDYDDIIPALFGDNGLEIIKKFQSLPSANVVMEKIRSKMNIPAVYSGQRHAGTYWGYNRTPSSRLMSGIVLDVDGSKGNPDRNSKSSVVWYCKSEEHADNMYRWLDSMGMKLYMSQIDGGSDHLKGMFHLYPDCPISDRIASVEEMYKAAGFSDELIDWINEQ
jgi:hypothetical protein